MQRLRLRTCMLAAACMLAVAAASPAQSRDTTQAGARDDGAVRWTPFPILMYDTDIGFGYGAKLFLMNLPARGQSLDLLAFNSTKGERWYRLALTAPDAAARLGTAYGWGLDVTLDYDTYLENPYYGTGPDSRSADLEYYTREPFDISAVVRHAPTATMSYGAGLRWRSLRNMRLQEGSVLRTTPPTANAGRVAYLSLTGEAVHDTRDNFHRPTRGTVLRGEIEAATPTMGDDVPYLRVQVSASAFTPLAGRWLTGAARIVVAQLAGGTLPVQALLPLGGGWSLRGIPRERYLDRALAYANAELRCDVVWRFSLIAGVDAGRVARTLTAMSTAAWIAAPVVGLRLDMDDFLVRADVAPGPESLGFYLNFGHVF